MTDLFGEFGNVMMRRIIPMKNVGKIFKERPTGFDSPDCSICLSSFSGIAEQ